MISLSKGSLEGLSTPLQNHLPWYITIIIVTWHNTCRLVHPESGRTYHEKYNPPKESMKDDASIIKIIPTKLIISLP